MDDVVVLDIRDDGIGFAAGQVLADGYPGGGHGYGLTSMRRRCGRVAGTLGLESAPGEGTTVTAIVPAIPLTEQGPA
ncbi:MAG TPA: ATP-binding protein [Pseudonocardiaceae bacterium]|jgi:signal transduction histidine kinase